MILYPKMTREKTNYKNKNQTGKREENRGNW